MQLRRLSLALAALVASASLLQGSPTTAAAQTDPPAGQTDPAAQPAPQGPAPCNWIGRVTRPPDRLTNNQTLIALKVESDLSNPDAAHGPEDSVVFNAAYGATFYDPYEIRPGLELEVFGYVRQGGQCVVDTLNIGTVEPGYEGYLRPKGACPTADAETVAVHSRATRPLGCAVAPIIRVATPIQRFQGGQMLWLKAIYAVQYGQDAAGARVETGGTWSGVRDTFRDPEPEQLGLTPPAPELREPRRGFGKAWRESYGGASGPFGWAVEDEHSEPAVWQLFEGGIVIVTNVGDGFILYRDGRAWERQNR